MTLFPVSVYKCAIPESKLEANSVQTPVPFYIPLTNILIVLRLKHMVTPVQSARAGQVCGCTKTAGQRNKVHKVKGIYKGFEMLRLQYQWRRSLLKAKDSTCQARSTIPVHMATYL